jgi:hypothetical protein
MDFGWMGARFCAPGAASTSAHLNAASPEIQCPKNEKGIVPDDDTALHQALKVLIPVFGRANVSKQMPFEATYFANKPNSDDRVWRIEGTRNCPNSKAEHCRKGRYSVDVNRWSGDVVRVFTTD